ncbi:MAG: saccharopine dehydrogenase NADP-binding domain-containing protein [Defluviimonas denitrificans]
MSFTKVAVLGLGKVGHLAAELLAEAGFDVTGIDARKVADTPFPTRTADLTDTAALGAILKDQEAVLSCLPYHLNIGISTVAHGLGLHYFDLTEDVPTTQHIRDLAKTAKGLMAPHAASPPVSSASSARIWPSRSTRSAPSACAWARCRRTRPGFLDTPSTGRPRGGQRIPQRLRGDRGGVHKTVSAMEWLETIYIDGLKLEAFTTSGGLGTMCETYADRVENLDYKTMRYPGHVQLMNFFFHELLMRENREAAGRILTHAKPPVDEDVVYLHVAAEGWTGGQLKRTEFVRAYYPQEIAGRRRTAIAWTTSASVVAVIEMVKAGKLPRQGFLKQETIPLDAYLATKTGQYFNAGLRGRR